MSKTCHITIRDEVRTTIAGLHPSDIDFLWNEFGIFVEGYFFMPEYKMGRFDGKVRFFEKTGRTYIRLLHKIVPYLEKWGYEIQLTDKRIPVENPSERITSDHFKNFNISLRGYQVDSINECLDAGSGFIIAGTGAGKSVMCAGLCDMYGRAGYRTMTIVPSSDLVSQTAEWYIACGMEAGEYSGAKKEIHAQHVVATWQSLQNNPHVMENFGMLIVDEAHGAKANVVQRLIADHGKNIPFRFGFTGTFPKPDADKTSLIATIGPILKEIPARWLIDNGYLAEIDIECVRLKDQTFEDGDFPDYASEKAFLIKSEKRLDKIADIIIDRCEKYGNTLVLVNSVDFGERLQALIKDSVFLYGESKKNVRKTHYDEFAEKNDLIVIATAGIAAQGISIDRVFCLVLVDAGKSFVRAIQSVGRGTRLADDKKKVNVVDIGADLKWSKKHMTERMKYYKEAGYQYDKPTVIKLK
jgi:superfamily II DNA or RNA helicase